MIIEDDLQELGATNIAVTVNEKTKTGTVSCDYNGDHSDIINAIKKQGYREFCINSKIL